MAMSARICLILLVRYLMYNRNPYLLKWHFHVKICPGISTVVYLFLVTSLCPILKKNRHEIMTPATTLYITVLNNVYVYVYSYHILWNIFQKITHEFFLWGQGRVMAPQDYFTHFEPSQLLDGAKKGDPWETPPDHPQAELGLSNLWPELGSNPQRWDDEPFRALKISVLNHSATEAANSLITMT